MVIFRCELLVSGRVSIYIFLDPRRNLPNSGPGLTPESAHTEGLLANSENDSTDFFPEKFDEEIPQMMGPWKKVSPVSDMASFRVSMLELSPNHLYLCKPLLPHFL